AQSTIGVVDADETTDRCHTAVTSQWGVGIRTSGRSLIMSFPEFSVLSPGERSTGAGLCIDSSRKPRKLRVLA
ncbi:MAG: hypothetical protein ACO3YU_04630, partial [Candidatus Nanopelagicales bacterium]